MSIQIAPVQREDFLVPKPKALFVHPDIHFQLKRFIANHGGTMQTASEEAVETWLRERGATPGNNGRG